MWFSILGDLGPISLLLGLFYFIVTPILLFRLMDRVKKLERNAQSAPTPQKRAARPQPEEEEKPARAEAKQPQAVQKSAPAKTDFQSLEEKVGAHWLQWIGTAVLVAALIFFLKWSFDNGLIGPTGRTLIGYILAGCAIIAGDRLRKRYGIWSLTFTGGGALASYIVTWIALHTYHLFPSPVAFAIYILTTAVTCLLAGYYGALPLAAFGIIGGFLTPILTGDEGSTFSLLLYILILDCGIFALGRARQWRMLNALGLMGTAVYEILALDDPAFGMSTALVFIAAFFVIYLLVPLYYNLLKQQKSEGPDLMILIGNALLHFVLVLWWLGKFPGLRESYDAMVSLGLAVIFLIFSGEVYKRNKTDTPLVLGSLSLVVLFTSLAIPLQLGNVWVPLAWSMEGVFLLWIALKLHDPRIQRFAWLVMLAAYFWYLFIPADTSSANLGMGASIPLLYFTKGFYLFLVWTVMFAVIATLGLLRSDRKEQQTLLFAFVGLAVLAGSFGMNIMGHQSTLTGFQRFIEAAALIGGSYFILLQAGKRWTTLTEEERKMFSILGVAVQIVTLVYLTNEFTRAVDDGRLFANFERPRQVLQVGISILWALYAAAVLVFGAMRNWKPLRVFGLIILIIATAKLTLIDFFSLGTGYRVIGFTILGAVLVAASFLYQHKKETLKSLFGSHP